jgi:hypothetical protein
MKCEEYGAAGLLQSLCRVIDFPKDYRFSGTTYGASAGVEATVIENTTL